MSRRSLSERDPVKAGIALAVQRALHVNVPNPPTVDFLSDDDVIAQAVSETETLVRVKTSLGVRYFKVKVSEML